MGIYLEDRPPARSQFRRSRRSQVSGAIVVHSAENQTDVNPPDTGAEAVAAFIARRSDPGSYHSIVDSNSVVQMGRYEWEMYHVRGGGNQHSLGLSFACQAHQWPNLPIAWVQGAVEQGAQEAARMAKWVYATTRVVVPARVITKREFDAKEPGFISHAAVDPQRRSDPGKQFPWEVFLDRFSELTDADRGDNVADLTLPGSRDETIRRIQRALAQSGFYAGRVDGDPYTATAEAAERLARAYAGLHGSVTATKAALTALLGQLPRED